MGENPKGGRTAVGQPGWTWLKIVLAVVETTPVIAMKIAQGGLFYGAGKKAARQPWALTGHGQYVRDPRRHRS
jgi:hypothetical protein